MPVTAPAEVRITESNTYYVAVRSGENTGGLGKDYVVDVESFFRPPRL